MSETPSSKSQQRIMDLLGIEHDGTYSHAARILEAQNLPTDGLPLGETWRTAGKLSDADLLTALGNPTAQTVAVADTKTVQTARTLDRIAMIRERERTIGQVRQTNPEPVFIAGGMQWENE